MKKLSIVLIILLHLSFSCKTTKILNEEKVKVQELGYGICSTKTVKIDDLSTSPTGQHLSGEKKLNIIKKTDTISIDDGVQFGIEYIITSPKTEIIPIKTIWIYPDGLKDNHGQPIKKTEYFVRKKTNEYTYSNYTLGPRAEMVTGDWVLELYFDDKQILRKIFHLK